MAVVTGAWIKWTVTNNPPDRPPVTAFSNPPVSQHTLPDTQTNQMMPRKKEIYCHMWSHSFSIPSILNRNHLALNFYINCRVMVLLGPIKWCHASKRSLLALRVYREFIPSILNENHLTLVFIHQKSTARSHYQSLVKRLTGATGDSGL